MQFTTDDGYIIKEGSKIFYTGDQANVEGNFVVAKIQPCEFYKFKVKLQEEDGGEDRTFNLSPANFDSGIGRRFKPMELTARRRNEVIKKFKRRK